MSKVKGTVFWLLTVSLILLPETNGISKECRLHDVSKVTCVCSANDKEFFLPEEYNYENVTSIALSSCSSANLHFSSLAEASHIEEISVRNISGRLLFELFVTSKKLTSLELSNIQIVPLLTQDTFRVLSSIERLEIRDVTVANFEEQFDAIEVTELVMLNVTVLRLDGFHFSERGKSLRIVDCAFRNISTSLNFAYFSSVEIVNSKFELVKPGHLSIESDIALILNSVFSNVSMNVVATSRIAINHTCADGKSSLRLSSPKIESFGNRLPTEIIYTGNREPHTKFFNNLNNTVCIAGNCKCPKSNSGNFGQTITSFTILLETAISIAVARWLTDP